jgi:hypothetical protein
MDDFWESDWYKKWLELSQEDYLGKRPCKPLSYDDVVSEVAKELRLIGNQNAPERESGA